MATRNSGKMILGEKSPHHSADTLGVKNVNDIALCHTVSENNAIFAFYADIQNGRNSSISHPFRDKCILRFTQIFKWPPKNGGKQYLRKVISRLCGNPGVKASPKSLYLAPFQ